MNILNQCKICYFQVEGVNGPFVKCGEIAFLSLFLLTEASSFRDLQATIHK